MTDFFHSSTDCEKCNGEGYYDTGGLKAPWGTVYLCECGCKPISQLEEEATHRLRTTNKIRTYEYNTDLELLHAIKARKL